MRKLIVLIFIVFIGEFAYSQQFPLQSQYQFNYSIINPSSIAENNYTSIRGSFRQQWVDLVITLLQLKIFLCRGFGKNGLGVNVFNDETGGALINQAYHLAMLIKLFLLTMMCFWNF